ncbi:7259_t:CDS:2 [Cetraspora pellucida]|uniref:7259_t:CDS:1 n=1 Tax=Cetraspora pellucida TaxID=1433469 RepID=A0A9N9FPF2_9GLOM|nr:7259_t:CDS:2 [Cetraspora pellucida]
MSNVKSAALPHLSNTIEYLIANAAFTTKYLNSVEYFNTETSIQNRIIEKVIVSGAPLPNAAAQKKAKEIIIKINDKIAKYQEDYNSTIYPEAKCKLINHIRDLKNVLQRKKRPKFKEALESHKFGAADSKRRKEVIKVRIINHLQEVLESKYDEHLSRTTVNNYLLPCHSNSIAAKKYHHPTNVQVKTVLRNKKAEHQDNYYCLASVKAVKQFASLFSIFLVIVSQDDKAKVPLGIFAISRTFQVIQSINEPVIIPDHDFLVGSQQKLVLSVYLIIDPSDTNYTLCSSQLSIYIRLQYEMGTSSITHMNDLYLHSLDVKKCNNIKCCSPKQCEKAASLLASNDGFLHPLVIGKNGHYINSIHLLEYLDKAKIPEYD